MNVIEAKDIRKRYGKFAALRNIDFSIKQGQIVGLIGRNGAGKTTLLKSLLGLTPYQGELSVLGMHPHKDRVKLMERMCFIADVAILPRWITVEQAVSFVKNVHPRFDPKKAWEFLAKTSIKKTQKVKELSKGMITQLHLAIVLAIDVEILVLDEPTLGLDILYRNKFFQTILEDYYNETRTIIITTHQVEEIENLLTDLIIIDQGKIVLQGSMEEVHKRYTAVTVSHDKAMDVMKLNPVCKYKEIGRVKFIFENPDKSRLQQFGELSTPTISELFLAKVGESNDA